MSTWPKRKPKRDEKEQRNLQRVYNVTSRLCQDGKITRDKRGLYRYSGDHVLAGAEDIRESIAHANAIIGKGRNAPYTMSPVTRAAMRAPVMAQVPDPQVPAREEMNVRRHVPWADAIKQAPTSRA